MVAQKLGRLPDSSQRKTTSFYRRVDEVRHGSSGCAHRCKVHCHYRFCRAFVALFVLFWNYNYSIYYFANMTYQTPLVPVKIFVETVKFKQLNLSGLKYSGDLKSGLVWILNGKEVGLSMVLISKI